MKISVIIPVYNGEYYITRCLLSLQKQNYIDWEAIFVNDGSIDSTEEILLVLSEQESRVKVISQPNRGVVKARDAGVACATGDYILFLDVDDTLEPHALEVVCDCFEKNPDADIVVTGFNIVSNGQCVSRKRSNIGRIMACEYLKRVLTGKNGWELCAKAYRKSLFTDLLELPKGIRVGEDAAVFVQLVTRARVVVGSESSIYNYIQNESSVSHQKSVILTEETLKAAFFIEDYLKRIEWAELLKREIDAMFLLFYSNSTRRGYLGRKHLLVKRIRKEHVSWNSLILLPWYRVVYVFLYYYFGQYISKII